MPAEDVELMRPSMELLVSATSDTTEITTETVSRATSSLSATKTKDMMPVSRLASVLPELSLSEENVRKSPTVPLTHTTTQSAASVTQDSSSINKNNVLQSMSSSPTAQPTLSSMESHAPVTSESSSKLLMPVPPALKALSGTVRSVTQFLLRPVLLVMFTMQTSTNVSPQLLHVETMPTSTEPHASVFLASTSSVEPARNAHLELFSMVLSVHQHKLSLLIDVVPTRSQ